MKNAVFSVPWSEGLHMRRAAHLARIATQYRSDIRLRHGHSIADAKNILAILILCATLNTLVDVEISGADEHDAMTAVQSFFQSAS